MPTFNNLWFPTSAHGWKIINVKSPPFNAVGDFSTDDTAALQLAFDTAWGTRTAPFGLSGANNNRAVYLPPGNYRTSGPLYITGAQGAKLFGDSALCTTISIANPMAGNLWRSEPAAGSELAPCLCMNGNGYFTIDGLSLTQLEPLGSPANFGSIAIDVFNYGHTGGGICTVPVYRNMIIKGFQHGIMVGYGDPAGGNSENGSLFNVMFEDCTSTGLQLFHQNVLNWNVFGGGAKNCAHDTTVTPGAFGNGLAAYQAYGGVISVISGVNLIDNGCDFYVGTGPTSIMGGHSTSQISIATLRSTFVTGFTFKPPVSLNADPLDASGGGTLTASGCIFAPDADTGAGHLGNVSGVGGLLVIEGLKLGPNAASSSFTGTTPGGAIWVRGVEPIGSQNLFANYNGKVLEYAPSGPTIYNFMPAHAKFRGLTRVISDSPLSGAGLDITTGGGSNSVFAYCTGAAWRILGTA